MDDTSAEGGALLAFRSNLLSLRGAVTWSDVLTLSRMVASALLSLHGHLLGGKPPGF